MEVLQLWATMLNAENAVLQFGPGSIILCFRYAVKICIYNTLLFVLRECLYYWHRHGGRAPILTGMSRGICTKLFKNF